MPAAPRSPRSVCRVLAMERPACPRQCRPRPRLPLENPPRAAQQEPRVQSVWVWPAALSHPCKQGDVSLQHPAIGHRTALGTVAPALGHSALRAVGASLPRVYLGASESPYAATTCKPDSTEDTRVTEETWLEPTHCVSVGSCVSGRRQGQPVSHQHNLGLPEPDQKTRGERRNETMRVTGWAQASPPSHAVSPPSDVT